jgi:hypothetical protein
VNGIGGPAGGQVRARFTASLYGILNPACYTRDQLKRRYSSAGKRVVLTFQLLGLGFTALFLGALITRRPVASR